MTYPVPLNQLTHSGFLLHFKARATDGVGGAPPQSG